ncbi:DUF4065 domain-containing protein [Rhizobium phaseoli]|nr:DUF4065 domain-containing protein [Rhizobium phaseoli]
MIQFVFQPIFSPMAPTPRYIPNASKAMEVILWIANASPGFDVYQLVKSAFFADKYHLSHYGRPISGDTYQAAPFGPLATVVYNLLRRDPIEMIALKSNGDLPFEVDQRHKVRAAREANGRMLSGTDVEALQFGVDHVKNRTFDDIYRETHDDPAYINAGGGPMDYRDFLDESDPDKVEKTSLIEETARYAIF